MRNSIVESITSVIDDLYQDGLIDEITMQNIHKLCEFSQISEENLHQPASNYVAICGS